MQLGRRGGNNGISSLIGYIVGITSLVREEVGLTSLQFWAKGKCLTSPPANLMYPRWQKVVTFQLMDSRSSRFRHSYPRVR